MADDGDIWLLESGGERPQLCFEAMFFADLAEQNIAPQKEPGVVAYGRRAELCGPLRSEQRKPV